ncbi:AraC family transcriptional regulator [Streptomyces cavernicola]|uniref:AraC family transcriptional regulator n=1 Tax=Streptomyces cavernicola TaxID=3043613 RepID=A0ABT6SDJ6_9ACTN|nr:AraC family transcriptional regulator [Streptomyces sp. B-S-A6]MDI3406240.1 AraC family transcriptional regulator [Streptomyces sp. B-S-A6]
MSPVTTLERFLVLRTSDIDEFRVNLAQHLTPHKLTPVGITSAVHTDLSVADLGPVRLIHGYNAGAELQVQLTDRVSYYDVNLALAGTNLLCAGAEEAVLDGRTAAVISPRMLATMRLSDGYSQLHVRIERYALERHLEELLGRDVPGPIQFRACMDLAQPAIASWSRAVRLLVQDLECPGGLAMTGEHDPWSRFLMTGLLLAQPHNYSEQLGQRPHSAPRPAALRRVIDLIEQDPAAALTLDRLAREAGVTPRSLQRHSKEYVGLSPRAYVQSVRLSRAHDDLRQARPGVTVAEVAFRWGFGHVPRFAAAYQERYGVPPSVTLRHHA